VNDCCRLDVLAVSAKEPVAERVNSDVQLTCTVTDHDGQTNYSVSWYKDGEHIGAGKKYRTEDTAAGGVLTVRRVKESDVGLYQCAVTLGTGPARKTLKHFVNLFCTYICQSLSLRSCSGPVPSSNLLELSLLSKRTSRLLTQ